MTNYYEVLGVDRDAPETAIRDRFRLLARECHPDRFTDPARKREAEGRFQLLTEAVNVLTNAERRKAHDFDLDRGGPPAAVDLQAVAKVYVAKGVKAYREGNFSQAFENFEMAVHHFSKDPKALHYLALSASKLPGKARKGVEAIELALQIEPQNGAFHREAARLYLQVGLRTKAERHLEQALQWLPEDAEVKRLAAELGPAAEPKKTFAGLFGRKG